MSAFDPSPNPTTRPGPYDRPRRAETVRGRGRGRGRGRPALTLVLVLIWVSTARADLGAALDPADIWAQWNWDPAVLGGLILCASAYALGVRRLWRAAGPGRGISRGRVACFFGGLASLFVALVSPVDAAGGALFSMHMLQHLLLVAFAAPLVVLGRPAQVLTWAVPRRARGQLRAALHARPVRRVVGAMTQPVVVLVLHTAATWLWHMPVLYEAALRHELVHWLEHASFFGTSALVWHLVLSSTLDPGLRILVLFASATQGTVLGALLTLAPTAWYAIHEPSTRGWGLDWLADQQLAGLLMWVPGGIVYVMAALGTFALWLARAERSARRNAWMGEDGRQRPDARERRKVDAIESRNEMLDPVVARRLPGGV